MELTIQQLDTNSFQGLDVLVNAEISFIHVNKSQLPPPPSRNPCKMVDQNLRHLFEESVRIFCQDLDHTVTSMYHLLIPCSL